MLNSNQRVTGSRLTNSRGSSDEIITPNQPTCEFACRGCYRLRPPSPFSITQPESWYPLSHRGM